MSTNFVDHFVFCDDFFLVWCEFKRTFPCHTWNSNLRPENLTYRHWANRNLVDGMDFANRRPVPLLMSVVAAAVGLVAERVEQRINVQRLQLH